MLFASFYCLTSVMALFFTKNLYFRTKNSFMTPFFTQFVLHTHPITLLFEIWGGRMHGPSPSKICGGPSPSPLRSPPIQTLADEKSNAAD